ncbi:hypothetical protein FQZ97_1044940 [compost metagenome]
MEAFLALGIAIADMAFFLSCMRPLALLCVLPAASVVSSLALPSAVKFFLGDPFGAGSTRFAHQAKR